MTMELSDEVGVLAPDIRLPGGYPQNPYRLSRPSRLRMYSYVVIYKSALLTAMQDVAALIKHGAKAVARGSLAKGATGSIPSARQIYAPHGSLMVLHRRFFEKGGNLEHNGKMFLEEFHIAEEARRIGLKVIYAPALKVKHFPHSSVGLFGRGVRRLWAYESALSIWKKYFAGESTERNRALRG
jgi:GT2 family glycosyltransferase